MNKANRQYAPGSPPDIVGRLKQAIDANDTTRIVLDEGVQALNAIKMHLEHSDEHLRRLIADIEARAND